jgi:hypothetical protein
MRYKIQNGPDGINWVSLEPLLEDIVEQMDNPEVSENQLVVDSLFAVKAFVEALISEGQQQRYCQDDDEPRYIDTL